MLVRVYIPHYFREVKKGTSYGSGRPGARLARSLAFARCLSSLLDLRRGQTDLEIHIGDHQIDQLAAREIGPPRESLEIEITVCTEGRNRLEDILSVYGNKIRCLDIELENPRLLPLATRDQLIHDPRSSDLSIYLEDDLVISDREYCDKVLWLATRTSHTMVLMPHRYEHINNNEHGIMLVDGPLRDDFIGQFTSPCKNIANGRYRGKEKINFDIAANPHSGSFSLSDIQRKKLQQCVLPRSGFVGPLETAATLTVLKYFKVIKPSNKHRHFLMIEHAHPSFQELTKKLRIRSTAKMGSS